MKGKPSRSAASCAALRALESLRPAHKRVLYDPYAVQFLGGIYSILTKTRFLISSRLLIKIIDCNVSRIHPTTPNYVPVRARYIDDYLNQCIEDGID